MNSSRPEQEPPHFDYYRHRTLLALGGAALIVVGEVCVGGDVEQVGDVLAVLGGVVAGAGLVQFLQGSSNNRNP